MKKKVLLVGGLHKAMSLADSLITKGYEVTAINMNYNDCLTLASIDDLEVIHGDGTKPFILEEADTKEKDIVIALTQRDDDNLVICELSKKKFGIQKTVALVRDPQKTSFFYQMGIDSVVCAINAITGIIEQQAFVDEMTKIMSMEDGRVSIIELKMKSDMPIVNKKLWELKIPSQAIVGYILRNDQGIVPRGDTRILKDDTLIVICDTSVQDQVTREMTGQ
ncbi:potassium channel family protein [Candidatus Stoquefichus massiliensis]|uniref:potassium channel family protein n=1 Tax=Candidatus Stoquefichus massiliensis TaxID=1470350 RepID=UPI0004862048|nr:TrkA family potassium uptake protein [Candidatus Stoquefichus massiliensis]